ncbi:hypothetical protein [Candidatus Absconditicoccus praedator]|uniref:hypothetical protein n=1 Tax=Candidatus Absconditicoccus praedator TaxID=2735562 RepID=UPI001E62E11B|nr:hypothetical protein [Candidatus Absconditicoccus praedator]UFX83429.1 hypothetical protein HLG78_04850 [Candidatus Absconditicoccus praedator]
MKKKLISQWDRFSEDKREKIINTIDQLEEFKKVLVKKSLEKDPNLKDKIGLLLQNQKNKIKKKKEEKEYQEEVKEAESLLDNL